MDASDEEIDHAYKELIRKNHLIWVAASILPKKSTQLENI